MANESYEEVRRKRVEENKKKLDELHLHHLSFPIQQSLSRFVDSNANQAKRKAADELLVVRRRSGRIPNIPEPVNRETADVYASDEALTCATKAEEGEGEEGEGEGGEEGEEGEAMTYVTVKAEEGEAGLGSNYPFFVKPMLHSHTTGRFLIGEEKSQAATANESYEEVRRKRMEEIKKKMEELNLQHISLSLHQLLSPSPRPYLAKQAKRKAAEELLVAKRRSSRVVVPRKVLSGRVYVSDEARTCTIKKAKELEAELGRKYPSFVKPMTQSITTRGCCALPGLFCLAHLPEHGSIIVLVDEDGDEFDTTYLFYKRNMHGNGSLSAGWRCFSINHDLVDGDALVFQLIEPTTFKVYIIRASIYNRDST